MTMWQAGPMHLDPPSGTYAAVEDIALPMDVTAILYAGETVDQTVVPTVTIRDRRTDALVELNPADPAAWVSGDVIQQRIRAGTLTRGRTYELRVSWEVNPGSDVRAALYVLEVVA